MDGRAGIAWVFVLGDPIPFLEASRISEGFEGWEMTATFRMAVLDYGGKARLAGRAGANLLA